jgi:hypothetical protein
LLEAGPRWGTLVPVMSRSPDRRSSLERGSPETEPRSCGTQPAHESLFNRRLRVLSPAVRTTIGAVRSGGVKNCALPLESEHENRLLKNWVKGSASVFAGRLRIFGVWQARLFGAGSKSLKPPLRSSGAGRMPRSSAPCRTHPPPSGARLARARRTGGHAPLRPCGRMGARRGADGVSFYASLTLLTNAARLEQR